MSSDDALLLEMNELLERLVESRLDTAGKARLDGLVCASDVALAYYVQYMDLHGCLQWDVAHGEFGRTESAIDCNAIQIDESLLTWVRDSAQQRREKRHERKRRHAERAKRRKSKEALAAKGSGGTTWQSRIRKLLTEWSWIKSGVTAAAVVMVVLLGRGLLVPEVGETKVVGTSFDATAQDELVTDGGSRGGSKTQKPLKLDRNGAEGDGAASIQTADASAQQAGANSNEIQSVSWSSAVELINSRIAQTWKLHDVTPSPIADDAAWLRRIWLDLAGHIPDAAHVKEFLANKSPRKRTDEIDSLLTSTEHYRYFALVWTNLLIGRSEPEGVDRDALQKFLRLQFAGNKPWSDTAGQLIAAEGHSSENGATNFLLAHLNNEAVPATAVTTRLFLGQRVQCTQCHNHPFNDTKQATFWEINSFFKQTMAEPSYRPNPKTGAPERNGTFLTSQPADGATYYETRTGLVMAAFPRFNGHDVEEAGESNRRDVLAKLLTSPDDPQFAAAFINRLWSHFFGVGFTSPVDDMGPHNPPSHPELLAELSQMFIESGYDVRRLVREICLSDVYQLESLPSESNSQDDPSLGIPPLFSRMYVKTLSAEQMYNSLLVATRPRLGGDDWQKAEHERQAWLSDYVVTMQNDENDEANTFDGSIGQALSLMNGPLVSAAVSVAPGTRLSEVLSSTPSETERIRQLCLATLGRYPSESELIGMCRVVKPGKDKTGASAAEGYQDLLWALLNANEFALNR